MGTRLPRRSHDEISSPRDESYRVEADRRALAAQAHFNALRFKRTAPITIVVHSINAASVALAACLAPTAGASAGYCFIGVIWLALIADRLRLMSMPDQLWARKLYSWDMVLAFVVVAAFFMHGQRRWQLIRDAPVGTITICYALQGFGYRQTAVEPLARLTLGLVSMLSFYLVDPPVSTLGSVRGALLVGSMLATGELLAITQELTDPQGGTASKRDGELSNAPSSSRSSTPSTSSDARAGARLLAPEIPSADIALDMVVGKGGMGQVYAGRWRGTRVAVKVMSKGMQSTEEKESFSREAEVMARLRHPHICSVFGISRVEAGASPGATAVVMEFLDSSLSELLHAENARALDSRLRYRIMHDVATGIEYLHSRSFMHRDIKPANVMLDVHLQRAKVCDFGLSLPFTVDDPTPTSVSSALEGPHNSTVAIGTLRYLAPEVLLAGVSVHNLPAVYDERCDVYSFGLLLWEVVHQIQPFAEHDGMHVATVLAPRGARPPLGRHDARTLALGYDSLSRLIASCWRAKPAHRPTMSECAQQLFALVQMVASVSPEGERMLRDEGCVEHWDTDGKRRAGIDGACRQS